MAVISFYYDTATGGYFLLIVIVFMMFPLRGFYRHRSYNYIFLGLGITFISRLVNKIEAQLRRSGIKIAFWIYGWVSSVGAI